MNKPAVMRTTTTTVVTWRNMWLLLAALVPWHRSDAFLPVGRRCRWRHGVAAPVANTAFVFVLQNQKPRASTATHLQSPTVPCPRRRCRFQGNPNVGSLKLSNQDDHDTSLSSSSWPFLLLVNAVGLTAQPVVWVSLYYVTTTGAGLPAGPAGLLGAIEGLSYLVVVVLALQQVIGGNNNNKQRRSTSLAQTTCLGTLLVAAVTVARLVADQGCIPNAKPLLDYSEFVRVCRRDGPSLFGT